LVGDRHLAPFGALPTKTRVCIDRNRITGGGVTAGIDFALTLVSLLVDRQTAEAIQLRLEYNPAPPFTSGSPDHRAAGDPQPHQTENRALPAAPQRGGRPRRRTAGAGVSFDRVTAGPITVPRWRIARR